MPRQPRIRTSFDTAPGGAPEARRAWLTTWKRWAVSELPPDTPRAVRVQLRTDVERVLSRLGPEDDDTEVRDLVAGVVDEARGRLRSETEQATHARSKRDLLAEVGQILGLVLDLFPEAEVAAMLKRPGYSRLALTQRLRRHLDHHVTGAERAEQVLESVVAWVERRLAEQPEPLPRTSHVAGKVLAAAAATGMAVLRNRTVRDAAVKSST